MNFRPIPILLAIVVGLAMAPKTEAGLININLTDTTATGTGVDGNGAILGGGTWNRIKWNQAGLDNALVDNAANALAGITAKDAGAPSGAPQVNGNSIQSEAWGTPVDLTISGLITEQIYKVAVYSDRVGDAGPADDIYTVNGATDALPTPGAAVTAAARPSTSTTSSTWG